MSVKVVGKDNAFCSGMNGISIREASDEDLEKVLKLLPHITKQVPKLEEVSKIPSSIKILIAEDKGQVVGTVSMHVWERLRSTPSKACYVYDLIVLPDYRKKNVGTVLIERVVKLARSEGVGKFEFACEDSLVKYYEKRGFNRVGAHFANYLESSL